MKSFFNHFFMLSESVAQTDKMPERYLYCTDCIYEMMEDVRQELNINNHDEFLELFKEKVAFDKKAEKRALKRNKIHQYMITFTLDPKKPNVKVNDEIFLLMVQNDILKFFDNDSCKKNLIRCQWVREGNKADGKQAHWHFGCVMRCYYQPQWFKTYKKKYGNIQYTKSDKKNDFEDILDYFIIDKPKNTIYTI